MERLKKIIGEIVFSVQILITFILVFENSIVVPPVLQAFGRLHPLLLHLPIGLLLVTVLLIFTRRYFEGKTTGDLIALLLYFTALTASVTTLMGLMLSLEGTFAADQLWLHKWLGVTLSYLCSSLLLVRHNLKMLKPLAMSGAIVLIFTGHYGATLTHGEDFVLAPLQVDEPKVTRVVTDSTALFTATIEPILESKCYGCHNEKKAKGNLVLTSVEGMAKGGKNGPLWKAGESAHSLVVDRLLLPLDNKKHMPPKDKTQLSEDEIAFISLWINEGADTQKKLNEFPEHDTLRQLASGIISRYQSGENKEPQYRFQFASPDKIQKLSRPNRSVFQIARNEPAIQAEFFLRESFDAKYLAELAEVKEQLVSLNLSKMPVKDENLKVIRKFENLEVLNLNQTEIKGTELKQLAELPKLRSLAVSGTQVSVEALRDLGSSKSLREVFIWNTPVTPKASASLAKTYPDIHWNTGYIPDSSEVLKLNVPLLKNKNAVLNHGESVVFKHNLPGTIVRYGVDGSDLDSIESPVFTEPLVVGDYAVIKTKAFKEGWLSSDVAEFIFFRKGYVPDSVGLASQPDERYQGEGGKTLLDGNKGLPDFYRHPAWIAFRETDLIADFAFEKEQPTVKSVVLSYARNPYMICLPPSEMQVWGGNHPAQLKLIKKLNPEASFEVKKTRIEGIKIDLPPTSYKYYRLVAKPVKKLPNGNPDKRKIWLMVDEVFWN
jgi:uncharacterized membrane protein